MQHSRRKGGMAHGGMVTGISGEAHGEESDVFVR